MAATDFSALFTNVALTASTPKSVLCLITPANCNVRLKRVELGFNGVSGTQEAILAELVRFASDGTGTSGTIVVTGISAATPQSTFKHTYTVEPSSGTVLAQWKIHPQSLLLLPVDIILKNNCITGLRLTSANGMNCWGGFHCEE